MQLWNVTCRVSCECVMHDAKCEGNDMKHIGVLFGVGCIPALLVFWGQGLFTPDQGGIWSANGMRILSDGFFLSAVLLLSVGVLTWVANLGQFTSLKYIGHLLRSSFFLGFARRDVKSYGDFREEVEARRRPKPYQPFLLAGGIFLALAILSLMGFHQF